MLIHLAIRLINLDKQIYEVANRAAPDDNIHTIALKTVNGFKPGLPVDFGAGNSAFD